MISSTCNCVCFIVIEIITVIIGAFEPSEMYSHSFMTAHIVSSLLLLLSLPQFRLASNATSGTKAKYRIIGGIEVKEAEYPFVVHLLSGLGSSVMSACTGMIIDDVWVLTAAHCINKRDDGSPSTVRVYAGGINYIVETTNTQVVNSTNIIVHQDYDSVKFLNDIALIQVETPFDFSGCCVKKGRLVGGKFPEAGSMTCTVVGFGKITNDENDNNVKLHKLQLQASALVECFRASYYINDIFNLHPFAYPEHSGQKICVEAGKDKNVCSGDSGGPLVCDGLLVGMGSYVTAKAGANQQDFNCLTSSGYGIAVYNSAGYHIEWIKDRVPNITEPGTLSAATPLHGHFRLARSSRSLCVYVGIIYYVTLKSIVRTR